MKNRLSSRLRLTLSGVTLLTLLLMCVLVFAGMYFQTTADNREQLRQQAAQLSSYLEASDDPVSLLQGSVFTQRVTYLDTDGTVLYDSEVDASRLESHAGREEFQQARENGEAFTARSSATLGQTSLYYAKRLADGRVIRVSGTQRGMLRQVRDLLGYLLLGAVLCFGAAMAFSRPLAKRLAAPMNEVNLDQPLESDVYEELSPMLRRMAQQNMRIANQMASLTAQRHELDTVLGGMKEGFVILDEKRHVLTMNNAARAMFCITNDPVGQPMIAVSRDEALLRLLDGQGTECAMQLNGMTIHLSRSHVEGGGTALLMQDVTAAQAAEASRRQFSANVSHELRTPLTTISGYAELLSSGMLQKPEDATEFGRKILAESHRLLTLIEDIIRLSRLDEGVRGEVTPVDLTALIQHCVQKLTPAAQNAQVSISASGNDPVLISGDHALLEEMLTNLLENGIKYNHAGGYVRVPGRNGGRTRRRDCRGQRCRYSAGGSAARIRALLPRGQEPQQADRRHGTGAVHRQARRAGASRADCHAERAGRGYDHHADFPGSVIRQKITPPRHGFHRNRIDHCAVLLVQGDGFSFRQNDLNRRRIRRFKLQTHLRADG